MAIQAQVQFDTLVQYGFAHASLDLCLGAIQVCMWMYMASFLVDAPPSSRKRRLLYMLVSLIILVLSTASATLVMMFNYSALYNLPGGEWDLRASLTGYNQRYDELFVPAGLLHDIAIRIGELLLVYRCYIIWHDCPWVPALPAYLLLAGIGINIRTWVPLDFDDSRLNNADTALTITVNVLVTLLISFRLIRAQLSLNKLLSDSDSRRLYLSVVAILIEAAAPVTIFGIGFLITRSLFDKSGSFGTYQANSLLGMFFDMAAIIAPQLIVFRVATGTSWSSKADASSIFSQPLQFNGGTQTSSLDEESSRPLESGLARGPPRTSEKYQQ